MVTTALDVQKRKRIEQKGKHRPDKMVRGKLPDGSSKLGKLPTRDRNAANEAAADDKYCKAIDKISSVFGRQRRSETTAAEHRMYMRVLDGWLVREGFGSYVEVVINKAGSIVAVRARRDADGVMKVLRPQMLIAHLLQMAQGAASTPKGGHAADIAARSGQEAVTVCGKRSQMKRTEGAYGYGAYADEPWSLQAFQKRVYAVRAHARAPEKEREGEIIMRESAQGGRERCSIPT